MMKEHESYGMAGFHRTTSNVGVALYGSSIKHHHIVSLVISTSRIKREPGYTMYLGRDELIRVDFSPTQYTDLITSMNMGSGVPCTITRFNGKGIEECPFEDQRETYRTEFKQMCTNFGESRTKENLAKLQQILEKKTISQTDRKTIMEMVTSCLSTIINGLPFLHSQFDEAMDKSINEAKGEIEAFVNERVTSLGIKSINNLPELPGAKNDSETTTTGSENPDSGNNNQ